MGEHAEEPDEAAIAGRSRVDHLYTHDWKNGKGRYLNVTFHDDGSPHEIEVDLEPSARNRVKLTVAFLKENGDIKSIELKKFKHYMHRGWQPFGDEYGPEHITFRPFSFGKLLAFLRLITELDLNGITDRRLALSLDDNQALDAEAKKKLRTLLLKNGGPELLAELLRTDWLDTQDIVNVGYRKRQLATFVSLLTGDDAPRRYQEKFNLRADQPEAVWQHFFSNNDWIFGYGLDYRFKGILQEQAHISDQDVDGSNAVISDFLLADRRFTTFVEIKTPETPLFGNAKNRSRTWRLSSQLFDSVSQILEQKASGELRFSKGELHSDSGQLITQKPYDPKVVLIIGNWSQIQGCSDRERQTRARTLELFRRDSRNVDIITFDELLERAKFIVEHRSGTPAGQ